MAPSRGHEVGGGGNHLGGRRGGVGCWLGGPVWRVGQRWVGRKDEATTPRLPPSTSRARVTSPPSRRRASVSALPAPHVPGAAPERGPCTPHVSRRGGQRWVGRKETTTPHLSSPVTPAVVTSALRCRHATNTGLPAPHGPGVHTACEQAGLAKVGGEEGNRAKTPRFPRARVTKKKTFPGEDDNGQFCFSVKPCRE